MPIYAYKCDKCEYSFKLFHGIEENPGRCPACTHDSLKKQFLPTGEVKVVARDTPGKRVEKYIEETRAAVAEQMAEARKDIV